VRLTHVLQASLIKDLQALDERGTLRQNAARAERRKLEDARKARVERIVERVIQAEFEDKDEDEIDRLAEEACERLEHDDIYGDLMARPVSEIIALVCRDLGLAPDWSRLAEEAWAQEEIDSGVAAAPLMAKKPGLHACLTAAAPSRARDRNSCASPVSSPPTPSGTPHRSAAPGPR
jgi:chorismate mutase